MTRIWLSRFSVIGLTVSVAGCASITSGTSQAIAVNSDPAGADCRLTREGQSLGAVKTPGPVTIKRDSRPVHVSCSMPGYEDGKVVLNSRYETATMGNMILGGAVGMMVDSSTGASNRYDAQVTVPLTPLVGGQVTAPPPAALAPVAAAVPQSPEPVSSPRTSPGPYDGTYSGGVDLGLGNLRQIQVRVLSGKGRGTARLQVCPQPGRVTLVIDSSGAISGEADLLSGGACESRKVAIEGHVEDNRLKLTMASDASATSREFSLTRRSRGVGVDD